ncbi:hypothetical protein KAI87_00230 [Myxococcota bacterium]|nr:hypothetical protein [Myxococcota bacterium]
MSLSIGAIFGFVLVAIMSMLAVRKISKRREAQQALSKPAHSPQSAVRISSFETIDQLFRKERCVCDGRLRRLSEGSRVVDSVTLRVVHCECLSCEEEMDLFFIIDRVLN